VGISTISITFSEAVRNAAGGGLTENNFPVRYHRGGMQIQNADLASTASPSVALSGSGAGPYTLTFDPRIPLAAWTVIVPTDITDLVGNPLVPVAGQTSLAVGFLPMDLNSDGRVNPPDDVPRFLQYQNNSFSPPAPLTREHYIDVTRSDGISPADIPRALQLLNHFDTYYFWPGYNMGPRPPDSEALSADFSYESYFSTNVYTGEAVWFEALSPESPEYFFEWNFYKPPGQYDADEYQKLGHSLTHYFGYPGEYEVTLTLKNATSGLPLNPPTPMTKTITVLDPMKSYGVWTLQKQADEDGSVSLVVTPGNIIWMLTKVRLWTFGVTVDDEGNETITSPLNAILLGGNASPAPGRIAANETAVAIGSSEGVKLFSIANPAASAPIGIWGSAGPYYVAFSGQYLYATNLIGLYVLNVANPANPILINTFPSLGGQMIRRHGNRLYVSRNEGSGTVLILSLVNPTNPVLLGNISTGQPSWRVSEISAQGSFIALSFESPSGVGAPPFGISLYDCTNPASAALLSSHLPEDNARGNTFFGNKVYVSTFGNHIVKLAISDLNDLIPISAWNTGIDIVTTLQMRDNVLWYVGSSQSVPYYQIGAYTLLP